MVLVGLKAEVGALLVVADADRPLVSVGSGKDSPLSLWVESAQAFRIIAGVDGINESQISEVVHIDSVFKHDDGSI